MVEPIPAISVSEVPTAEVPDAPSEVLGGTEVIEDPTEVHDAVEVLDTAEVPDGGRSPSWAVEASQPTTEAFALEALDVDEL